MHLLIKTLRTATLLSTCALMLGACGLQLKRAEDTAAPAGAFEAGLHSGYIQLSRSEYREGDYQDSDNFARRAMAASGGTAVAPEDISARRLPGDKVGVLTDSRQRLVSALDASGRTKVPAAASRAQTMFDCWMQEQEENFQPDDIGRCQSGFEGAIAEVEEALRPPPPPPPAPTPTPEPAQPAVPPPADLQVAPRFYTVFFDFDSDAVNDVAARVIQEVLYDWLARGGKLMLVGHADTSGPAEYNQGLSERRAKSVRQVLEDGGMSSDRITDTGVGETDLAVPTADGVREPRNRRVIVVVEE